MRKGRDFTPVFGVLASRLRYHPGLPPETPMNPATSLEAALAERFGARFAADPALPGLDELARIAEHRSHRKFMARQVDPGLLRLLCACALSAPSKSDLQQADIVHVADRSKVQAIADGIPDMAWIAQAPVFLVFCGNNRRLRQMSAWRGKPFANEHLDHFMNAAVDAGLVMMSFIRAAEAAGLGACPISAVRNRCAAVSDLLGLPEGVFPIAGLCVGYPAEAGRISARLPLEVTVHVDRHDESGLLEKIDGYDRRRHALQPYRRQRHSDRYADVDFYGWSEDKVRQYSVPERADFGAYIRKQGFSLK
jgi:FMN reductase [NAD(P)H]